MPRPGATASGWTTVRGPTGARIWGTYRSLLDFAADVRRDQRELHPRDMIDLQSFIWVQGSDEYA